MPRKLQRSDGDSGGEPRAVVSLLLLSARPGAVALERLQDLLRPPGRCPRRSHIEDRHRLTHKGESNQAIADEIARTKRAAEKHINAIFLKSALSRAEDVSRRVKAALISLAQRDDETPVA